MGEDTGDVDEPAMPEEDDDDDKADGNGDFILRFVVSNSFGGGLITI